MKWCKAFIGNFDNHFGKHVKAINDAAALVKEDVEEARESENRFQTLKLFDIEHRLDTLDASKLMHIRA